MVDYNEQIKFMLGKHCLWYDHHSSPRSYHLRTQNWSVSLHLNLVNLRISQSSAMHRGLNLPEGVDGVYQPQFERAMVSLSAFQPKEIPKYCANKSQLVSKKLELNYIFGKSARAVFCRPSCDKRQTVVEMGKVKLKSCKSERIVPIWGVVRKSKCQPREEIRSEWAKKSIFRIWANVLRLQIQRWGRLKLGEGLRARPPLLRSILCFAS